MNIMQFFKQFPDEDSCREHFKKYRDRVGVTCKKCQCKEHYYLSTINYYKCKECGFRTSLKSGTVMENSKLPYQYWYMAFMFATSTKKSFSALEIQRQLNHAYYEPIWAMMHKIRRIMSKADEEFQLTDTVELDEGFFVTNPPKDEDGNVIKSEMKRGKGSPKQATVLVMAESRLNPDQTNIHKKNRSIRRIKLVHIEDHKSDTIEAEVRKAVDVENTFALTDDARHYSKLKGIFKKGHKAINTRNIKSDKVLPWVHTTISNAKRLFHGVHHSFGREYIQNYLSEFCFKFNRKNYVDMFESLVTSSVKYAWY